MRQRIVNLLKYNRVIYAVYYYLMSFCINVLKLFIRVDDKLILINSFAFGRLSFSAAECSKAECKGVPAGTGPHPPRKLGTFPNGEG